MKEQKMLSKACSRKNKWDAFARYMKRNWVLYALLIPALLDVLIFCYFPMYGVQISFRQYKFSDGITGSKWVGLKYFKQFLNAPDFWRLIGNTLILSLQCLVFGFLPPIILALLLYEQKNVFIKKTTQMLTYGELFGYSRNDQRNVATK